MGSYFQVSPEVFDRVQVRALAEPLKDIQRLVPKPLLCCLGCVHRVIVLLEGDPLPQPEVLSALKQVFVEESWYSWSESPLGAFWQTPSGLSCAFY